jgi:dihydrofolate reductase
VADNHVIGAGGRLPWRLATDMRRFKSLTFGKPVVMGRRTFESIGRALPGRSNIVLTRNRDFAAEGALRAGSLKEGLDLATEEAVRLGADEIMVIGGGEIFSEAIALAEMLYVTHVHEETAGETLFPAIDPAVWTSCSREEVPRGDRDEADTTFAVYTRKVAAPDATGKS